MLNILTQRSVMITTRILLFCFFIAPFVFGENLTSPLSPKTEVDSIRIRYHFNPIVVTATKVAGAQRDLASSLSLVDKEKLQTAPSHTLLEIMQTVVPSLYATEWGVMGFGVAGKSAGKISLRGMGGGANTHVLILRNGRPDFMGLMGCTIADEFTTDGVDRIEIIRGPGSFLYGTNATGGIINIISKKMHRAGFETQISNGYGSFQSRTLTARHGGKIGNFDYYITAATRKTDGHRDDANSSYAGDHYTIHLGYVLSKKTTLEMNGNLSDIRLNDPGQITDPKYKDWYNILRYGGDVAIVHQSVLGESHLMLHGNFGRHQFFDGWHSNDRILGFMVYQNTKPFKGNMTSFGFDYKRYGGNAVDATTDYGEFFITEFAPYFLIQQLFGKRSIFSTGFRLEHHQLYGNQLLPKAGLVYHPSQTSALRLSIAQGFRSPSIRELYFWLPANKNLKPDRLWNAEIGLTQNMGHRMQIEAVLFRSEGKNLIQFSAPPPRWVNSGQYIQTGYEIVFNWLPLDALELGASWTKMDLNKEAYNTPGKKLTAYVQSTMGKLKFFGSLVYIRDWMGAEFQGSNPQPIRHPMRNYTVIHLSGQAAIVHGIGCKVTLKNLLNTKYEAMYGYPMPGRHMLFDITYDF